MTAPKTVNPITSLSAPTSISSSSLAPSAPAVPLPPLVPSGSQLTSLGAPPGALPSSLAVPGAHLTSLAAPPGALPPALPHSSGVNLSAAVAPAGLAVTPVTQLPPPPAHGGGVVKQLPAPTATSQQQHVTGSAVSAAAVSNSSSVTGNYDTTREPQRNLHGTPVGRMAPPGSSQLAPPSGAVPISTNVYSGSAISSTVNIVDNSVYFL